MKRLIAVLVLSLFLITGLAAAQEEPATGEGAQICEYVFSKISFEGSELPKGVPFSTETFVAYTAAGEVVGNLQVVDRKVIDADCFTVDEPSYIVTIKDKETVERIIEAQDGVSAYNEERKAGNIVLEGQSFAKNMKVFSVNAIVTVVSWFR